jgi:hypothetical protein
MSPSTEAAIAESLAVAESVVLSAPSCRVGIASGLGITPWGSQRWTTLRQWLAPAATPGRLREQRRTRPRPTRPSRPRALASAPQRRAAWHQVGARRSGIRRRWPRLPRRWSSASGRTADAWPAGGGRALRGGDADRSGQRRAADDLAGYGGAQPEDRHDRARRAIRCAGGRQFCAGITRVYQMSSS